MNNGLEY